MVIGVTTIGTLPVHPIIAQPRLLLRVWESLQGIPNDLGRGLNFSFRVVSADFHLYF